MDTVGDKANFNLVSDIKIKSSGQYPIQQGFLFFLVRSKQSMPRAWKERFVPACCRSPDRAPERRMPAYALLLSEQSPLASRIFTAPRPLERGFEMRRHDRISIVAHLLPRTNMTGDRP